MVRYWIGLFDFLLLSALEGFHVSGIILSGSVESYSRFPKWAQTFENTLTFEFKTHQTNALLFYTDDGNVQGNFYCLTICDSRLQLDFRIGDDTIEETNYREINSLRVNDVVVDDGRWHKFTLFQGWENVKVQVDESAVFKVLNQQSFIFGNLKTNSDVFIGGIPDINLLMTMSSPLRRHTKRFAGSVKNLIYRLYPQGVSAAQILDSNGYRQTDDDYCNYNLINGKISLSKTAKPSNVNGNYCLNEGRCYSSNEGPKCDCAFTNFEGDKCEKKKETSELSFFGNEWLGYDVSENSSAITNARWENITFSFKTIHPTAILFTAGDNMNYLHILLDKGIVIVLSKFYGTDQRMIRIFNKKKSLKFDDASWHHLNLYRDIIMNKEATNMIRMRLTVDEYKDEIKQNFENKEWIGNSFAYVGGVPKTKRSTIPEHYSFFRGCMNILKYEANSQLYDLIELSSKGFSKSVIRTEGELSYACTNSTSLPDVISFTNGKGYLALPKWNSLSTGSLAFQFKTSDGNGLIFYHGMELTEGKAFDFIAFELVDGFLWMVIDLGSGIVKLQASPKKMDKGVVWHCVEMERIGRSGSIIVDGQKVDFSTPGVSSNLIIDKFIYLGGAPFYQYNNTFNTHNPIRFPPQVWSAHVGKGYKGCLKNLRLNGINVKIGQLVEKSLVEVGESICIGCLPRLTSPPKECSGADCFAMDRYFAIHHLDSKEREALTLKLPYPILSEAETFTILFKSEDENVVLFETKCGESSNYRVMVSLIHGEITLKYHLSSSTAHSFAFGSSLADNKWHLIAISRFGTKLLLWADNKLVKSYFLSPNVDSYRIPIDTISFGFALHNQHKSSETSKDEEFEGEVAEVTFNGYNMLNRILDLTGMLPGIQERAKSTDKPDHRTNIKKHKSFAVNFGSTPGYVLFHKQVFLKSTETHGRISFKFKTIQKRSLLLLVERDTTIISEKFVTFELLNGKIFVRHPSRGKYVTSSSAPWQHDQLLNDLKWHSVQIVKDMEKLTYLLTIDNSTTLLPLSEELLFPASGNFFFGGFPEELQVPEQLQSIPSFRGCLGSLRVGRDYYSFLSESQRVSNVVKGCENPIARCEPETCHHGGFCTQNWSNVSCACHRTTFSGSNCEKLGTTFILDGKSSITYTYPANSLPCPVKDELSIGFQTYSPTGYLFLITYHQPTQTSYLKLFLSEGYIHLKYNLGLKDHHLALTSSKINEGKYHVLRLDFDRSSHINVTISMALDDHMPVKYTPVGGQNGFGELLQQKNIILGANFRKNKRDLNNLAGFRGKLSGVYFNSLYLLDLFALKNPQTTFTGSPKLVYQAPQADIYSEFIDAIAVTGNNNNFKNNTLLLNQSNAMNIPSSLEVDGIITAVAESCLSLEDLEDTCLAEINTDGFSLLVVISSFVIFLVVFNVEIVSVKFINKKWTSDKL